MEAYGCTHYCRIYMQHAVACEFECACFCNFEYESGANILRHVGGVEGHMCALLKEYYKYVSMNCKNYFYQIDSQMLFGVAALYVGT